MSTLRWHVVGPRQYVSFINPKGIRNLEGGLQNPKIAFHRAVKELERELGDPNVTLNSFIISNTRLEEISWLDTAISKETFAEHNVLFQEEGYVRSLLNESLKSGPIAPVGE